MTYDDNPKYPKPVSRMNTQWSAEDMRHVLMEDLWNTNLFFIEVLQLTEEEYKAEVQKQGAILVEMFPRGSLPCFSQLGHEQRLQHERDLFVSQPEIYQRIHNLPDSQKPSWFEPEFFMAGRNMDYSPKLVVAHGQTIHSIWQRHCAEKARASQRRIARKSSEQSSTSTQQRLPSEGRTITNAPALSPHALNQHFASSDQSMSFDFDKHSLIFGLVVCNNATLRIEIVKVHYSMIGDATGEVTRFPALEEALLDPSICPQELQVLPQLFYRDRQGDIAQSRLRRFDLQYIVGNAWKYMIGTDGTASNIFLAKDRSVFDCIPPELLMLHLSKTSSVQKALAARSAQDSDDDGLPLRASTRYRA